MLIRGGIGENVKGYIQPGVRHLDGYETLWYSRTREGSDDYSRMARQKCVMNAMLHQVSPQVALRNFSKITEASTAMISTNLPRSEVDRFIALALKAKDQKLASVSLVPPLIDTGNPDIAVIREAVAQATDGSAGSADEADHQKRKRQTPITGGSLGTLSEGYAANQAGDLAATC
jgi:anionic cell wall polymer biosynthesis LytR-Cps2A-Psr (LCP) family protein